MSGGGRRGRRGGRRQRRREEQRRGAAPALPQPNGSPDAAAPATVLVAPAAPGNLATPTPAAPPAPPAPPFAPAPPPPAPVAGPASAAVAAQRAESAAEPPSAPPASDPPPRARPMSARELVAKLEALRLEAEHAVHEPEHATRVSSDAATEAAADAHVAPPAPEDLAPRRFRAQGADWLARSAGRGTGGTGRVAQARIELIRFSPAEEPERISAEVLVPHVRLDDLYDDELAELLERGLRSGTSE